MNRTTINKIRNSSIGAAKADAERTQRITGQRIPHLLAKIDSSTAISGAVNRWLYTWTVAELQPTSVGSGHDFTKRTGELWLTGQALNVCEAANTSTFVGPNVQVSNIPTGFSVKPVAGFVLIYPSHRANVSGAGGEIMWMFYAANSIDGVCV